ncbi:MFS transporter [Raphidocelis subcapitata]|uniref:MFS transporter n=1 Tax=Raphidocelis subcapitata TaxID=307507 RepID=A0A2V0PJ87_9CHLO|nr:MFS transporter [Raphidocelis subcapitata]|eukprot:GBF99609.1 MFS transporter [Raphidocelis subcapitata]
MGPPRAGQDPAQPLDAPQDGVLGGTASGPALQPAHSGEGCEPEAAAPPPANPDLESALRKVGSRVIPLCFSVALMNHLDRSNLAYASLALNRDNNFDAHIYSVGAALFFVTFAVFQVPANLVMVRVGFRPWLAFLLVAWGIVAVCFMFISSAWSFYLLRLLLGVFEAGAFPAMWYALSVFFPRRRITKPYAYLTIGIMVANVIGSPLATGLLAMDGLGGLRGWQWLFLVEGLPSILLGLVIFLMLPNSIASARFLTPPEREALAAEVALDHVPGPLANDLRGAMALLGATLRNGYIWMSGLCGALTSVASHTYLAYTPIIISNLLAGTALSSKSSVAAGAGNKSLLPVALALVPYSLASATSFVVAASSQRRDEQFWHVCGPLLSAGVILALFPPLAKAAIPAGFLSLSISLALAAAANGPAMALVSRLCKGPEAVVALPLFSSFSVIGGIVGPLLTGALMGRLGGFTFVTIIMGSLMVATGLLVIVLRAWVMHDGGLPDGGVAQRTPGKPSLRGPSRIVPPGLPSAADDVCVLGRTVHRAPAAAKADAV